MGFGPNFLQKSSGAPAARCCSRRSGGLAAALTVRNEEASGCSGRLAAALNHSAPPSFSGWVPNRKSRHILRVKTRFTGLPHLQVMCRFASLAVLTLAALLAALPTRAAEGGAKKGKAPEHKTTQSKSYIMLDPIYTTIVGDNRAAGMLMVGAGLDVPNEALHEEVDRSMPVLRDAYVRNLMTFTANVVRTDAQPDVAVIAERLQAVTDRALKKKGAKVLLAQVAIRVTAK
jgi:flagellar basal body-associated protein FliL